MKWPHLVVGALMFLTFFAEGLTAQSIEGSYKVQGADPGEKSPYTGKVTITKDASVYKVGWELGSYGSYQGTGLLVGNVLAVAYGGGKPYGVAVYQVEGGKLSGRWTVGGKSALGEENLEGPAGLSGTYKITSAKDSKGNAYTGSVVIAKTGSVYKVKWILPNSTYSGVGVLQENVLAVAWGQGTEFGAVAYAAKGSTLSGIWAGVNSDSLGKETLSK